jgi:hypothetical protein
MQEVAIPEEVRRCFQEWVAGGKTEEKLNECIEINCGIPPRVLLSFEPRTY